MMASMMRSQDLEILERRRAREVAERLVLVLGGGLALLDAAGQELVDAAHALLEKRILDLADDRLVSCRRGNLRDAGSHQAAAEHADCFYRHRVSFQFLSSLLTARGPHFLCAWGPSPGAAASRCALSGG